MPVLRVSRRYRFSAAHRLHSAQLSDEENQSVYGKCNYPYGHGHDYTLDVTVRGELDSVSGRLVALDELDSFVRAQVMDAFDRRNLNTDVPEFAGLVPTTENLACVIARRLESFSVRVEKIRIWETPRNIIEVSVPEGRPLP